MEKDVELVNNEELKNRFQNGVKDFQIVYRKGGKNIKKWLANTNINNIDSSNIVFYGCYDCGRSCIEYFYSYITKRRYKVRQNVNCHSRNVI